MSNHDLEIVILNDHASLVGGAESVAIASALGLAERGVPVTFFACNGPVEPRLMGKENLEVVCTDQHTIATNPNRLFSLYQGIRNGPALERLGQVLSGKSPRTTVVHVHSWSKALSPYALDLVVQMGFRLVITLHDFFIACPNGAFFLYKSGELCHRAPLSPSCLMCNCDRRNYGHKLWRGLRTIVQNKWLGLPPKTSFFIGVSNLSLGIAKPYLPSSVPVRTVRHPVFSKDEGPTPVKKNKSFVFIGRFSAEKGVRLFAEAARKSGLPAMFIGDGPLMPVVRQICPQGIFTGWLSPEDIQRQLRTARALVFPPHWYETLGLTVIEAAAAGVPAIVADHCAATDYIKHGVNGLHFARGSSDELAEQMERLFRDDKLTELLGRKSYQWYWDDPWTSDRHVTELLEIYSQVRLTRESIAGQLSN